MTESCPVPAAAPVSIPCTPRLPWRAPTVTDLAPLAAITLQSPIEGGEGGFSWLDLTGSSGRLG